METGDNPSDTAADLSSFFIVGRQSLPTLSANWAEPIYLGELSRF